MSAPRSLLDEVLPRFDAGRARRHRDRRGSHWPLLRLVGSETTAVRTREDFLSFDEPGYAKAAISFLVRPERGGSRVITETRAAGTSPEATRALLRYWRAIRPGSGAIRRSWLAAIRRRAVRAG